MSVPSVLLTSSNGVDAFVQCSHRGAFWFGLSWHFPCEDSTSPRFFPSNDLSRFVLLFMSTFRSVFARSLGGASSREAILVFFRSFLLFSFYVVMCSCAGVIGVVSYQCRYIGGMSVFTWCFSVLSIRFCVLYTVSCLSACYVRGNNLSREGAALFFSLWVDFRGRLDRVGLRLLFV